MILLKNVPANLHCSTRKRIDSLDFTASLILSHNHFKGTLYTSDNCSEQIKTK